MGSLAKRLESCFGDRSGLAGESLRVLCGALAHGEPSPFNDWRDVAGRLYGSALDRLAARLKGPLKQARVGENTVPPDRVLFALQSYYALVVRHAAAELAGRPAAQGLDDRVFAWMHADASPAVVALTKQVSDAVAECCKDGSLASATPACDLFKRLYESVFPRALRHALGEYYTPDWLAEHVLRQAGWPGAGIARLLDPSCGSGTFLMAAIGRLREECIAGLPKHEQLARIVAGVTGFDLNPLAVLTARANYLIAVRDLLPADAPVSIPVFRRDTICDDPADVAPGVSEGPFDLLAGNPPWIAWDNLPDAYRRATLPLWRRYGLFSLDGNAGRHGGAKKDLAMLLLYVAADRYLRVGGRVAMVVSQTLLHTHGAGDGFRRFRLGPDGSPLCVLRVDDLSRLRPFPEAVSCTATLLLEKGRPTEYPVPYVRWLPGGEHGRRGGPNSPRVEHLAEPIDAARPGSPWLVRPKELHRPLVELVGPSDYTARLGANSAGANGVYWVELLGPAEGGVWVRNLATAGRHAVEQAECVVEPDLLFPLLRWGDLAPFRARPAAHVLMPQDFATRTGLPEDVLKARYPKTFAYLARFEPLLRRRAAYRRYQADRPFYSMYNVGPYTAAGVKVVWRRMDTRLTAAVVEPMDHVRLGPRPVIPQETCVLIDCKTADEAHYLCALVSSALVGFLVGSHSVAGGKGFGTPGILEFIRLRRFDPGCEAHRQLAAASRAAHRLAASGTGSRSALVEVQRAIDRAAAAVWGLAPSEQEAIAQFMA
ncbi:MAG: N-6 DNA methylase [Patescibacteria group bacterium]|nr:N-6 DNA methylase [Patescibacteria group bacterium]